MRRRILIALVSILVCAAATTGARLQASTECERWIAEYRDALAHSPTVQRADAARHRLRRYVHRKVAAVTKPKPRVLAVRYQRPKMSREEALHKMEFACGAFGEDEPQLAALSTVPAPAAPAFIADRGGDEEAMPTYRGPAGPASLLAQNNAPSYSSLGSGGFPGGGGGGGGYPLGGVPTAQIPGGGGGNGGTEPGDPGTPAPPPTAAAPEPAGMVLMATGLIGVAGMIRRRAGSRG